MNQLRLRWIFLTSSVVEQKQHSQQFTASHDWGGGGVQSSGSSSAEGWQIAATDTSSFIGENPLIGIISHTSCILTSSAT